MARSVMQHSFAQVPRANIPRSSFDRSHGNKLTLDADYLVPVLVDDMVPGDTVRCNMNVFARLTSPTVLPIMDNMYLESFFFFVPYRLIWDNFTKFHGAQDNPADSIDYTIPIGTTATALSTPGVLADYMGLPIGWTADSTPTNMLPFRAYRLIWNEWFRDQNLQDSVTVATDDGPDNNSESGFLNFPLKRGKRHDYFTACLPAPQRGDAVSLPLSGNATINITGTTGQPIGVKSDVGGTYQQLDGANPTTLKATATTGTAGDLYADLSSVTATTINDLRLAFQTQRLLERDARSGTRYPEMILAHFGVTVPDFRLQRPEFLGGGSSRVNVSPVAQTTYQGTQTIEDAKGALSGIGTVSGRHGFTYSSTEHGVLLGLINVRADLTYSQGVDRYWSKSTRYDFYYPVLSMIGEQAVLNSEIFSDGSANDLQVFGYQERYAEYRYKPSRLCALMRPDATGSLSAFHLSEDFASLPTLDDTFIQSNTTTPLDRALSVPSQPQFVADLYFEYRWARPMPLFGVPGQLDHL